MRTPLLIATAALTAALLAGCGGNDPAPSPSPTPSPTASSTGRVAPPLPPAATAHTKAGAIAFVRHYIDLINYTQATGDTKPISAASESKCRSCASSTAYVERIYHGGGKLVGGATRVTQVIAALSNSAYGDYEIDVAIRIAPSRVVHSDGSVKKIHGGTNALSIFPHWRDGSWRVAQWTRAK